jgi:ketosteroid isomerase-like protein
VVVTASIEGFSARSSVTVEAAQVDAQTAIRSIIADYARALTARDVDAVRRAYPGLTQQDAVQLRNTFAGTESLEAVLAVQSLDDRGDAATAQVAGTYRFVAGGRRSELPVRFTAIFERVAGSWRFIERRDGS